MSQDFAQLIDRVARLLDQRVQKERLDSLAKMPIELDAQKKLRDAWQLAGLEGSPVLIGNPTPADLPFLVHDELNSWSLVRSRDANGRWQAQSASGVEKQLGDLSAAQCFSLPRRLRETPLEAKPLNALGLVRDALLQRKSAFSDAIIATGLVNLLTLATSIYSMQVYDRVIPAQGFSTLWVLTVGVLVSITLEFSLKQLRSRLVDRTCNQVDHQLSEWLFARMLGIRMEAMPASVGTLASQVKGFELVRGVLASTSLFVFADVPFALLFLLIITLIGGSIVLVPIISMPIALLAGLYFQRAIQRQTLLNMTASNRKAGLLVEAVDGVETLKANAGEWRIQSRWNRLVVETGDAELDIRSHATFSQNLTAAMSQISYVVFIAFGAYLVTENHLTMGGLIACSIISNRVLAPIVQLPAVMVQWAHAKAAIDGLEKIISLPNEADDVDSCLTPGSIAPGLLVERVSFSYGAARQSALQIDRLEIRPGERVGLIGAIGSGKSTLLKLASGLYRANEGKTYLGGLDMALLNPQVLRETIAYLPQETRLFSGTLRENLLFGLADPGDEAILQAAARTGLDALILGQPKGLALELTEGGRGVSGGQMQLIALTRMLLAKPALWLLDEPTGAMDSLSEARVVRLLGEMAAQGATLVVTTHKTALLPLFDRLIVLQGGRVFLDGPRDAVLAKLSGRPSVAEQGAVV